MIALNLLRKHIKQTEYKKTLPAKLHDIASVEVVEDESAKPFETLFREEKAMIIHKQLQTMPELMRLVTILILMEGLTQKVAAGILTCSEATVSRQLDAARNWLRVRLQNLI